ncbi:MAG: hypothetical protein OEZ06_14235 [Myxococcales bacterium]|nr:hypothetical protein [Myxococcales bacterium]
MRVRAALLVFALLYAPATAAHADAGESEGPGPRQTFRVAASAGMGVTLRAVDLPSDGAILQLRSGLYPAFEVGFALLHETTDSVTTRLGVRYQSSLLRQPVIELHVDGSERALGLRSHRLELELAPSLRLDQAGRWALSPSLAYALLNLRPEVHHLLTPSYSLGGPLLRLSLSVALIAERLLLHIGPEVQYLLQVGDGLREHGVDTSGLALGAEAGLELQLSATLSLRMGYRQKHALIGSSEGRHFRDVSHFGTLSLVGKP